MARGLSNAKIAEELVINARNGEDTRKPDPDEARVEGSRGRGRIRVRDGSAEELR